MNWTPLGDGEYLVGGYRLSKLDVWGKTCRVTCPDGDTFTGTCNECIHYAQKHAAKVAA